MLCLFSFVLAFGFMPFVLFYSSIIISYSILSGNVEFRPQIAVADMECIQCISKYNRFRADVSFLSRLMI